jgi:hypothetical protein
MRIPDKYSAAFKSLQPGVGKFVIPYTEIPADMLPEQKKTITAGKNGPVREWELTPTPDGIEVKRIK